MKQKIIPIVSVVVGVIAFILTAQYIQSIENELRKKLEQFERSVKKVEVMVATADIPEGTKIAATDIAPKHEYQTLIRRDAVHLTHAKQVLGRKTILPVKRGDILCWSYVEGEEPTASGLASIVKPQLRAISISVGGAAAVSGLVQPNDHVDILGTFNFPSRKTAGQIETVTLTLLQDVTILATGQAIAKQQYAEQRMSAAGGYSMVTLEVTPREAEVLIFAQQMKGNLALSLRNPNDPDFLRDKDLQEVDFNQLEKSIPELNLFRQKTIRYKRNL